MATSTGTLSGTVTDHTGKPVREVYVTIPGPDRFAITGDDGRYVLHGPAYRRYAVRYYKEGYQAVRQEVILRDGATTTVDVVLAHV